MVTVIEVGLAVGYVSFCITNKNGMYNCFRLLRDRFPGIKVLRCHFCLSFYLAICTHAMLMWAGELRGCSGLSTLVISSFASAMISAIAASFINHLYRDE